MKECVWVGKKERGARRRGLLKAWFQELGALELGACQGVGEGGRAQLVIGAGSQAERAFVRLSVDWSRLPRYEECRT